MPGSGFERAPWATDPGASRGRLFAEPASPLRTPYQRDRDRLVHSTAFRRLKYKTQVFVYHEGDHYRTRLTHTLEVAQVARSIARALTLDEDLTEALALAHDVGHPPFGHAGERALDRAMAAHGGFDHNGQSLRVVTRLECRYAEFDGLNLTWETLEGLVKHNGPLTDREGRTIGRYAEKGLPHSIEVYRGQQDLMLWSQPSLEAQIAGIADDIAYDSHDIDDGIRAGLFGLQDLREVPFVAAIIDEVDRTYPGLEQPRRIHEMLRRLLTRMIEDVIAETRRRLGEAQPASAEDVRLAGHPLAGFSGSMAEADRTIKAFLFRRMYREAGVTAVMENAQAIVADLFARYRDDPAAMGEDRLRGIDRTDAGRFARRIADYIAGMTDRFAIDEHRRLFDDTPELR